ncbi:hypothetical protein JW824_11155 [bacterium]|nr:hypothetical protein [bacterium]
MLLSTDLLLKGGNIYKMENMPAAANVYGIGYQLLVYPFAKLFGSTFVIHRSISGVCILCACFLIFVLLRKMKITTLFCIGAALILYVLLLFYATPLARPDGLGTFLFISSVYLPYMAKFSRKSLLLSNLLGILAFYTKVYFVVSLFYVTTYLFIFISKRKAIYYGLFSFFLLFATGLIINRYFETYFLNTFFTSFNSVTNSVAYLWLQCDEFLRLHFGLVIVVMIILLCYFFLLLFENKKNLFINDWHEVFIQKIICRFDIIHLNKPLINIRCLYSLYCMLLSIAIVFFWMGRHPGAYVTYFYQLITPFLLVFIFDWIKHLQEARKKNFHLFFTQYSYMFLIPCLIMTLYRSYSSLPIVRSEYDIQAWTEMEKIIDSHQQILNSPVIASLLLEQKKPVYDSGHTEFFQNAYHFEPILNNMMPSNEKIAEQYNHYLQDIAHDVKEKVFDAVIITNGDSPFVSIETLQTYYSLKQSIDIFMYQAEQIYQLDVWEPQKDE